MGLLRALRIGDVTLPNNLVLSPMAGYSDLPFRTLCRAHGAGLVCTEMVAASSVEHEGRATMMRMVTGDHERPVSIQIVGNDPEAVRFAAGVAGARCEILGFNLGCPARQVARTGCGAALLDHPDLAVRLVEAIKAGSDRPLLVKMRAGTGRVMDCAGFARRLERAGADGLIFHARTAAQSYRGRADWSLIRQVKEAVAIPVLGNGDVVDGPSAARALEGSGCDGLAIGRGALGDPRLFGRIAAHLEGRAPPPGPAPEERLADFRAYVHGAVALGYGMGRVVPHAHTFSKGLPGASELRGALPRASTPLEVLGVFEAHVAAILARRAARGPAATAEVPPAEPRPGIPAEASSP